jgi:hypothetical protein
MNRISIKYNIKIWVTSSFFSPFLTICIDKIFSLGLIEHFVIGASYFILFAIFIGLMFSVPALIIFSFIIWLLKKSSFTNRQKKYILAPISILLACLTLYFVFGKQFVIDNYLIELMISYSITNVTCIFMYRLNID